jgi:tetratricopeptide (TPR) repeat protein
VTRPSAARFIRRKAPQPLADPGRPIKPPALQVRFAPAGLCWAAALALLLPLLPPLSSGALAQAQEEIKSLAATGSAFDINAAKTLVARGDAAVAAGNLAEARRHYDQARDASRRLLGFYRDLSGAFRGLDARIPREMDEKSRQALELLVQTNMRLAALFRRQGQPEVAVPLLVEVVKVMSPSSEAGRKAYQQLLEIGFVSTPYAGGGAGS